MFEMKLESHATQHGAPCNRSSMSVFGEAKLRNLFIQLRRGYVWIYRPLTRLISAVHFNTLLHRVLDIHCQIDSSQCLAQLTSARVGKARSVHMQLGASPHCHKMIHSLSLPTVTYICTGELPHFHHSPTTSFLHSQPIQTPPSGPGAPVPLVKCSFGMIPLSRHSVDRSPRAFHSSTHNMVRASCFESRKLFLDGSMCLAGRWPWSGCLGSSSWRQRSALAATFQRVWGGAIPASEYEQGIAIAFKQPVIILHVSFKAMSTCPVCLERPNEEQTYSAVEKTKRQCGCSYGSWMSTPFRVC